MGDGMRRFMYGRNGYDKLCLVVMWAYLSLWLVTVLLTAFRMETAAFIVSIFQTFLMLYWLYRILSRNVEARRREVVRFFGYFRNLRRRFRDRKTHVYRKCPHCKEILRLPRRKGHHTVCCPVCKERFDLKIR